MSVETLQNLIRMTELGMTVLFENELPESVPGYSEFKRREKELEERKSEIEKLVATESRKVKITNNVNYSLNELQIRSEEFNSHNLSFIRKRTEDGFIYFVSNFSNRNVDAWIPLVLAQFLPLSLIQGMRINLVLLKQDSKIISWKFSYRSIRGNRFL